MKHLYLVLIIGFISLNMLSAQNLNEAIRYSYFNILGTASSSSTGNSFNALGADFASSSMNPAGLAGFRNSYFIITPSYRSIDSKASLDNNNAASGESGWINLNNIGAVFTYSSDEGNWKTSNLSIGINKLADFDEYFKYSGRTVGSITERFVERANGLELDDLDDFEAYPAYNVGAIYDGPDGDYVSDIRIEDSKLQKDQFVDRTGAMNEFSIAWGGSYKNNLDIGFSLGIPFISFEEVKEYNEIDDKDEISNFQSLYYKEYLSTKGTGINLKIGAIYKLKKVLRFGLTVQSPTYFILKDEYYSDIAYKYNEGDQNHENSHESPIGNFKYKFATPWSATASVGKLFRSGDWRGFINLDVDYKDYTANRFNLTSYSDSDAEKRYQIELNDEIDVQLQRNVNYRLGGEIAYKKVRLRLGYGIIGSPYKIDGATSNKKIYSIGTGYRWNSIYIDISVQNTKTEEGYIPYLVLNDSRNQLVSVDSEVTQCSMTIGFNF